MAVKRVVSVHGDSFNMALVGDISVADTDFVFTVTRDEICLKAGRSQFVLNRKGERLELPSGETIELQETVEEIRARGDTQ
jgi:hypothetical protein